MWSPYNTVYTRNRILGYKKLVDIVEKKYIDPVSRQSIGSASIDLTLSSEGYIANSVLKLTEHSLNLAKKINLTQKYCLQKNTCYIIKLQEKLRLPANIYALTNNRSTTARLNISARVFGQNCDYFDQIPSNYNGPLYLEIIPLSFPIIVQQSTSLCQIRFYSLDKKYTEQKLVPININLKDKPSQPIGFVAQDNINTPIEYDKLYYYHPEQFWTALYANDAGNITIDPGKFYIFASSNSIQIPNNQGSYLQQPLNNRILIHSAGFFEPGFGIKNNTKAVLEVKVQETPLTIQHAQVIGVLSFNPLVESIDLYNHKNEAISHKIYDNQQLKLAKQFIPH